MKMTKETGNEYNRIQDLPESERPRERLATKGAQALNQAELLAILLRVGVEGESAVQMGDRLLREFNGLPGLHRADLQELCASHGMGLAKAAQIKAAIELGRRLVEEKPDERPMIHSPTEAADLISYEMSGLQKEELWVLLLDNRNRVIAQKVVYKGSVNQSQVRVGEIFTDAVRHNATAVIVAHNHPSGDPTPSPEDIAITRAIVQAGVLLDIKVLDHLVVGQGRWVSLKERGLGFSA
jgi:DNA repair protein RadC